MRKFFCVLSFLRPARPPVLAVLLCLACVPAIAHANEGDDYQVTQAPETDAADLSTAVTPASGDVFAEDGVTPISLRMLLQTRYGQTFARGDRVGEHAIAQKDDGWILNRAFLRAITKPAKWMDARILLDVAELWNNDPEKGLKLAYVRVDAHKRVQVTAGLFKRPFSLLELLPISEYEFARLGPADDLIADTGFGSRDVGAQVRVAVLPKKKWLALTLGAFGGNHDKNDARWNGLLVARAESEPFKHWRFGADFAYRRYRTDTGKNGPNDYLDRGSAWSADVTYTRKIFELRAEVLGGDRTDGLARVIPGDPDQNAHAQTWLAAWGLAVARFKVAGLQLMPGIRAEYLDGDRDRPTGTRYQGTGVFNVDFSERLRLTLDVTRQWVQGKSLPLNGKAPGGDANGGTVWTPYYDVDFTRVIMQLQVRI